MKIEHIAIWVNDLEGMKKFYETYFNCQSNTKYHNREKKFESYFLTFESGARLEIMRKEGINQHAKGEKWDGHISRFPWGVKKQLIT